MGWRLFRRVRIAPGVRLNLSRSGPSLSIGPRGFTRTIGPRGVRTTIGIPGTGLYYTQLQGRSTSGSPRLRCASCHHTVPRTARFCPTCGARLRP
ncbi:MAG TPA: DUF4236 domain-containing protein [Candidatus Limnocylindrales bacterium]|nr:DUF4236 domain-containing protein [Candidatus Limnocylindrales bacterium]